MLPEGVESSDYGPRLRRPNDDRNHLPPQEQYRSSGGYDATALLELTGGAAGARAAQRGARNGGGGLVYKENDSVAILWSS